MRYNAAYAAQEFYAAAVIAIRLPFNLGVISSEILQRHERAWRQFVYLSSLRRQVLAEDSQGKTPDPTYILCSALVRAVV